MNTLLLLLAVLHTGFSIEVNNWKGFVPGAGNSASAPDNTCQKLPCSFNNKVCGYSLNDPGLSAKNLFGQFYQSSKSPTNAAFQAANLGDADKKLPPLGGYAVAQGLVGTRFSKYAFTSPEFISNGLSKLRFSYHARVPGSWLDVCFYGQETSCFFKLELGKNLLNSWQTATIPLPKTAVPRKVTFVARNLGQGAWVGVDKIEVIQANGNVCKG